MHNGVYCPEKCTTLYRVNKNLRGLELCAKVGKDLRRDLSTMCEEDVAVMCRASCLGPASRQVLEGLTALPAVCPTPLPCIHQPNSDKDLNGQSCAVHIIPSLSGQPCNIMLWSGKYSWALLSVCSHPSTIMAAGRSSYYKQSPDVDTWSHDLISKYKKIALFLWRKEHCLRLQRAHWIDSI